MFRVEIRGFSRSVCFRWIRNRGLLPVLFYAFALWGDEIALVRAGDTWRYFKGTQEPAIPALAWQRPEFDDSHWEQGASGFGTGFIDGATELADMPLAYRSLYLRKTFPVEDPASIQWVVLRIDYQGGFVASLNGTEIARRNMPGEPNAPVAFNLIAPPHSTGIPEEIDLSDRLGLMHAGENVLAIQGNLPWSVYMGGVVTPELLANFTRGPVVQNVATNHAQIVWKTPIASDSEVEYGLSSELGQAAGDTSWATNHAVMLTNLAADTLYYYRARSRREGRTAVGPIYHFKTLRLAGALRFVVVGDTGFGTAPQQDIARVMSAAEPELVLHVGDVIYPELTTAGLDLKCFSIYQPQMRSVPFYFAAGNHDYYDNPVDFKAAFYLPTNSVTGTEDFYSFDHGDAHFVVLNTVIESGADFAPGSAQYQWLEADLAATAQPWKFLFFHDTIHDSGMHRNDDANGNGVPDRIELQQSVGVLAGRYGVQVIFTGHDHLYERCSPVAGTHTIVTGGGGAALYRFGGEWDETSTQFSSRYHCVLVNVAGDLLEMQALGLGGQVFDTMTIRRTPPVRRLYEAAWYAPVIETRPANDGHGNIIGQVFDFRGAPMHAFCGQFSNLGGLRVNNDDQTLFIGLDNLLLTSGQNVFLFIESFRQSGVTKLAGLVNGVIDPEGEGVDGLDFLANLSFTNFAPSLGCVLGDEYGDGQYRSFARKNLSLNIGQGAFQLRAGFPEVSGVRLQQFHRSPQSDEGLRPEPNVNFIKLAIPFRELGGLQPGDTIKIGALVAQSLVDANPAQRRRQLDSGFVGYAMWGGGMQDVLLEGVQFTLAVPPFPTDLDSDGDGLRDNWEIAQGFDSLSPLGQNGAAADPDGDGANNVQEQGSGTDPHDASSVLRLALGLGKTNAVEITWPAIVGKRYALEYADLLPAGFKPVEAPGFPRLATRVRETYTEDLARSPVAGARFYRIRVVTE